MESLYCTIYIVDVSQNPEEVENITSRIQQLIEDHGGVIKRHNPWGKRRLAYPILNKTSGFYVEIEFSANSHLDIPKIIEKEYRLNDRVLRYLTYVVTKKELLQREINAKRNKGAVDTAPTGNGMEDRKPRGGRGRRNDGPDRPKKEQPARETKEAPAKEAPAPEAEAPEKETAPVEANAPAKEAEAPVAEQPAAAEETAPAAEEKSTAKDEVNEDETR